MVFPFTDAVARKSGNDRHIVFSSARCVFINTGQVRQNIFQPLHKCLCICLLLRDYRLPRASVSTVCGTICCSYIVKITRTIDLRFLPGNNLPRMMIQNNAARHFYLGTTNTDLKLCYIWSKVDIFSIGYLRFYS